MMDRINNKEIEDCLDYESRLLDSIQIKQKGKDINYSPKVKKTKLGLYETLLKKIHSNDLIRYAFLSFVMLLCSTFLLSIVEWNTFSSSVSDHLNKDNPSYFDTFLNTFWWSVVTFTTVGYGDVSPVTHLGKIISIFIMLLNFGIVTMLGGAVASVLVTERLKGDIVLDKNKFNNHIVITGWNHFIKPMLKIIDDNSCSKKNIILINETDSDIIKRTTSIFHNLDITHINDNPTQDSVLKKAFIENCSLFMVLPDYSGLLPNEQPDEDKTVLTSFTAKSISEDIRVIAHIFNAEYETHLQRVNVNEIVFIDPHVPHILAKHITDPGVPQLYEELLDKDDDSKGIHVLDIPDELVKSNHEKISAYYRLKENSILLGYAITKAGFSIVEQMGNSGSEVIRKMITEQIDNAGIKLSSDENIIVKINPKNDYSINSKHKAIIIR